MEGGGGEAERPGGLGALVAVEAARPGRGRSAMAGARRGRRGRERRWAPRSSGGKDRGAHDRSRHNRVLAKLRFAKVRIKNVRVQLVECHDIVVSIFPAYEIEEVSCGFAMILVIKIGVPIFFFL